MMFNDLEIVQKSYWSILECSVHFTYYANLQGALP